MANRTAVVKWLLDGDPQSAGRLMRDLTLRARRGGCGGAGARRQQRGGALRSWRVRHLTATGAMTSNTAG